MPSQVFQTPLQVWVIHLSALQQMSKLNSQHWKVDGTCKRILKKTQNHPESHPKRSQKKPSKYDTHGITQMPLALNQARLSLPSSAKHVNHVTRTTTLLQIPLFEAKLSQATSISNCPYACAVITILYREMIQHEMCRYFMTRYNFIELSFYAFNSGDTKSHLHPFTTSKALDFGGWHNFRMLLCWEFLVNGCQWFVWLLLISRLVERSKETGNFIKLGGGILTLLPFSCGWEVCPSQLWITSFNLWNWIQISSDYTNHNSIWFESRPWHFRKKCDKANHQSGQKQAIHTTANRITRGLLAGRLSAFRCAEVQGGLAAVNKFERWSIYDLKVMQEKDVENLHDLVVYPTQNEESVFPVFNSFLASFRKNNIQLGHKRLHGTNSFFNRFTNNQDLPHYVF